MAECCIFGIVVAWCLNDAVHVLLSLVVAGYAFSFVVLSNLDFYLLFNTIGSSPV